MTLQKSIFLPETPACLPVYAPREDFFWFDKKTTLPLGPSPSLSLSCVSIPARRATCADESRLPVEVLPLDLVQEVEIALVKVVHSDVTVLSSGRVALAGWVRRDGVLIARVSMQKQAQAAEARRQNRGENLPKDRSGHGHGRPPPRRSCGRTSPRTYPGGRRWW